MPPAYVKPYVRRGKTDARDAEAICEVVTRPTMRLVPIKSIERQAALALHRTCDLLVRQRNQLVNIIPSPWPNSASIFPRASRTPWPSIGGFATSPHSGAAPSAPAESASVAAADSAVL
jgi:hypothetical protein